MSQPAKVTVTGAAGQIGYALLFRIASGQLLGPDRPVHLNLLEIPDAVKAAEGTALELFDCAFPLLAGDRHLRRRRAGVRRRATSRCSSARARARRAWSAPTCSRPTARSSSRRARRSRPARPTTSRVLVVGNPANTNALIAQRNADGVPRERFTAMTRLDHNRAVAQLAQKTGAAVSDITNMAVWGNHSPTMYPDLFNAKVNGERAWDAVGDESWVADTYIPRVGKRGAEIIEARGASSAASAANAAIDHVHDWVNGTADGDWVSMAVPSDGSYGVEEGIISSFPCRCSGGEYEIVQGLDVPEFSQERIDKTVEELKEEREAVKRAGARLTASRATLART